MWVLFITCCVLSASASSSFTYYCFLGFFWFLVLLHRCGISTYTLPFLYFFGVAVMVFDGVWWCLMVFDGVWWCLMVFDGVWWCLMVFDGVWWCCQFGECHLFYFRLCVLWEKCVENWVFGNVVSVFYFLFLTDDVLYLKFYGSVLVCIFGCLVNSMSTNFIEGSMRVVCLQFWFCSVVLVECMCSSNPVENILLLDPTKN